MISGQSCVLMARYNAWQNRQLAQALAGMDAVEVNQDRGAFFGSIMGTLNHLLWGDGMWMARFDGGAAPLCGMAESTTLHSWVGGWLVARVVMDERILAWAETVDEAQLQDVLTWHSGVAGCEVSKPMGVAVAHMFNHQTHHRGQIHAMVTAAGVTAPVSDLVFMPDDV